jgi:LuxR family transcriptional regulator, quorum-sensing system regulator BjaR1
MNQGQSGVLDFIVELERRKTINETWQFFMEFSAHFGLQFGGLAEMPSAGERLEDTTVCLSWPDEWHQRYLERNYLYSDPAYLHLARSIDPYTYSEVLACPDYSKAQRRIFDECSEFNMKEGLLVPIIGLRTGVALISVSGDNPAPSLRDRAELHLAAIYTHAQVRLLSKRRQQSLPLLSARERECLQWVAAGKTDWEIGEILAISEKTANAHIERVKQKYCVSTRMLAVVYAMRSGIIQVPTTD